MSTPTLASVTLDCADPQPLATFWAELLGGEIAYTTDDFVGVKLPGGMWIGAYRIDGYTPPTWPEGDTAKQFHLDLSVDDLDAAAQRAVALGAVTSEHQPQPGRWRVLSDPAGHPFCVTKMT